jgi:hypothetical protein
MQREFPESRQAVDEEARRARRVQWIADLTCSLLAQPSDLTLGEAVEIMAGARREILALFPDRAFQYRLLYRPRFLRILVERFGIPEDEIDPSA